MRIDRGMVDEALKTTPHAYWLTPRNPERTVHLGGDTINFTLVAGPPNVHDMERGRRAGNLRDYHDLVRLAQHFNCITMIGNQVCAPIELPANSRHLDTYFANLTLTDKAFHVSAIGRGRALDGISMMAISRGLTLDEMRDDPAVTTIISVNSPRRFDDAMAEGLMTMAEFGQSTCVTPFTLMGAMSPVTLAGALAQQNAEALFGVVLTQLVRPGAPVHLWRLHLQRRHALGRAGLRHAGEHQGQRRVGPARAALQSALPHDAGLGLQRRRRARRL